MMTKLFERRALRAERRRADTELISARRPSPRLAWRIAELVSDDVRVETARRLTDIVHAADERLLPGASPVDRGAVRECRAELLELASRVFDTRRPVAARGIVLLERMLERGALYGHGGAAKLRLEALAAREALEPLI